MSIFVREGKLATLFRFLKYLLIPLISLGIYSGGTLPAHASPALETSVSETPVTIYYSQACGHCHQYIEEVVEEVLKPVGFKNITVKDFIYEQKARQELVELTQKLGIPMELRGHLAIFIGDSIIYHCDLFDSCCFAWVDWPSARTSSKRSKCSYSDC